MRILLKKLDGWTKEIEVCETTPVDAVRQQVIDLLQIPHTSLGQIEVLFQGNAIDRGNLANHRVNNGDTLMIVVKQRQYVRISVVIRSETLQLQVESSEGVQNLKEKIHEQEGYAVAEQVLSFNGRQLNDGRLNHHGITEGSVLHLELRAMQIFVKDFQGKTLTFNVHGSDTVEDLQSLVQQKTGVTPAQQTLTHEGRQLQSGYGRRLNYYNIREHSTLHLTGRLRGG